LLYVGNTGVKQEQKQRLEGNAYNIISRKVDGGSDEGAGRWEVEGFEGKYDRAY
jgi:hypothetical protein